MTDEQKIEILREMEPFVYQIAYYMMNGTTRAIKVSQETVKDAFANESFFRMNASERKQFIRELTVRHSLNVHFRSSVS